MLGINTKRELIKGEFAQAIREAAWRAATHNYNEADKKQIAEEKKFEEENNVSWDLSSLWV